jgi:LPXTG-motif cell wall-anchored protein
VSYLDDSNYLGSTPQVQMQLPQELMQQLGADVAQSPVGVVVPVGWIRLPGGIVMKNTTAILLGLALAVFMVWWYTKKKKK